MYEKSSSFIELKTSSVEKTTTILENIFEIKDYEIKPDSTIMIYDKVDNIELIVKKLVEENIDIYKVLKEHKTLEEYYIDLTGE